MTRKPPPARASRRLTATPARRPRAGDRGELLRLLPRLAGRRILVLADLVADEFVTTGSPRVSREAPVLILRHESSRIVPGGGGNAAANIAALGGVPVVVGEVGDDEAGRELVAALRDRGADVSGIIVHARGVTPRKTRILAGDKHVLPQQVLRIDRLVPPPRDEALDRDVRSRVVRLLPTVEGVLVSDYGLGFVNPESVDALVLQSPARKRLLVSLDSRHRLFEHAGVDVATPSEPELEAALGIRIDSAIAAEKAAREGLARLRGRALVLTRGSEGMIVVEDGESAAHLPAFGAVSVVDVTGAGDTVIATLALALAAGASPRLAARLANAAAGLVVGKPGTATVTAEELSDALAAADSVP